MADTFLSVLCEPQNLAPAAQDRRLRLVADRGLGFRLDPDRRGCGHSDASRPGDDPRSALTLFAGGEAHD